MEETLIKFKTALLAKEKGFNPKHSLRYHYYTHDGILDGDVTDLIKAQLNNKNNTVDTNIIESLQTIKASTQSLLQKFLREKHNIDIYIKKDRSCNWSNDYWNYTIEKPNSSLINSNIGGTIPNTYEDALEEGLIHALNLIK